MGDLYSELLVKKDKTAKDSLLKYGLIVLTVLAVFAGLIITPLALIIAVALGIACYFVIPKTDVEYEYLFINGDFDIDMIMSKTKRKKVKSFKLSEADLAAPLDSHRMDYYNGNQNMKVLDFSSGNPEHKRFGVSCFSTCKQALDIAYCGSFWLSVQASTTFPGSVKAQILSTCSLVSS